MYRFIQAHPVVFAITAMCRVLRVCRRADYAWREKQQTKSPLQDEWLLQRIRTIHADSGGRYGVRRVHAVLRREWPGIGRRRVHRLMRQAGLRGKMWRRRRSTTPSDRGQSAPQDQVARDFSRSQPDQWWVADSTYIRVPEGFGYLAVVMDACSRRLIGRHFSRTHDTQLMLTALHQAVSFRPPVGVIHHSDRGVQYLSDQYRTYCEQQGIQQSVERVGNSYDNAAAEAVFATIKRELSIGDRALSFHEMQCQWYDYIDRFYHSKRLHSKLDHQSPIEYERHLTRSKPAQLGILGT